MIWYQYLFLVLGVSLYSLSQLHSFGKLKWQSNVRRYSFFGPDSWVMKYKHEVDGDYLDWDNEPRYFGSTTFLVWTTDFYHCAQMLMKICFSFGIFGFTWWSVLAFTLWTGIQYGCFKLFSK